MLKSIFTLKVFLLFVVLISLQAAADEVMAEKKRHKKPY